MDRKLIHIAICLAAFAMSAAAQTVVQSSGTTATVNNVPYVSAATTTSTTLNTSPLSISGGNVGMGPINPVFNLDLAGNSGLRIQSTNNSSSGILRLASDNSVSGGGVGNADLQFFDGTTQAFRLLAAVGNAAGFRYGGFLAYTDKDGNQLPIRFFTSDASNTLQSALYIQGGQAAGTAGNVGIGTTNPGAKLEINGNLRFSGDASGVYQTTAWTGVLCGGDYAEAVDVSDDRAKYEPGDVLVIDPDHPGKFLKSIEAYSTGVTGVYSTKPGVVGRRQSAQASPDEIPMAMIGIVPVRASAENGSIRPGDLLVTSSKLGYAMKGTDRTRMLGAVIGKALGSLDADTGVIEVAVTLQ